MAADAEKNYHEWLKKADADETSAKVLLESRKGAAETVCFLSQQMAEKHLKALLVFHATPFPKVHDLLDLETRLLDIEPRVTKVHTDAGLLNLYYIETRYPGDFPDITWPDAEQAFAAASQIKSFVMARIGAGPELSRTKRA